MKRARNITSIRQLAKALSRDDKAVRLYLKDDRWTFRRTPPWKASDIPAMVEWRAKNLDQQPDSASTNIEADRALGGLSAERIAKIKLVIERTAKVRLERELLAGKYLARDAVQADLVSRANEAKQTLAAIVGLAPRLVGRDEADIKRLLNEHVELSCNILAGEVAR